MVFQIIPKRQFRVPVYADCISPDNFEGKELNEIVGDSRFLVIGGK